jgi:hypothetical protein
MYLLPIKKLNKARQNNESFENALCRNASSNKQLQYMGSWFYSSISSYSFPDTGCCKLNINLSFEILKRFLELGSVLEPGKTPKMDKSVIINDAIRMVTELRSESKKLKESNESLQDKIKELKVSLYFFVLVNLLLYVDFFFFEKFHFVNLLI